MQNLKAAKTQYSQKNYLAKFKNLYRNLKFEKFEKSFNLK